MTVDVHPELVDRGSFAHLPLGRIAPPPEKKAKLLQLAKYVDDATVLPHVPGAIDYSTKAKQPWGMMLNNDLGDCTCAAAGHLTQVWTSWVGSEVTPPDSAIGRFYWETGNPPATTGEPGGPTDTGRVETDVLNYWRHHVLGGHRINAYAAVDLARQDHTQAALYLFGGLYLGIALPITAQRQKVWDVVGNGSLTGPAEPGSWGGHAVAALAYDQAGIVIVTWGALLRMTWRFFDAYVDEAYAVLSPAWLTAGRSPAGFDATQLAADLAAVTQ